MLDRLKKVKLVPRLIAGVVVGTLIGAFLPAPVTQVFVTFSGLFSTFLKFIIPLMILGFVIIGIADLAKSAGKLLAITTGIAYASTIVAGSLAYLAAVLIFPLFIQKSTASESFEERLIDPIFAVDCPPLLTVTQALILAFCVGLTVSMLRHDKSKSESKRGEHLYNFCNDLLHAINIILEKVIIPFLPLFILGTFANIAYSGEAVVVFGTFWKVFVQVILLHILYIGALFIFAGAVGRKNPLQLIKNQVPGYVTAIGTQSSAATIPVNLQCAKKNGVTQGIRDFVVPLCATIHLAGSIITITSCVVAVLMMNGMDFSLQLFFPFLLTLGVAMVAAPGAPGGAIMAALPFLVMVGIGADSAMASLLIALYITQDSFGTAANVSGDNAIAVLVDKIYSKYLNPQGGSGALEQAEQEVGV